MECMYFKKPGDGRVGGGGSFVEDVLLVEIM